MMASMLRRPSLRPVGVGLQVEPKRKFVERERRAGAIADRHEPAEEDGERRVRPAQVKQPAIADQQQDENAPHQVMNMVAAHHDPMKWPHMMSDQCYQHANADKGEQK